MRIVKWSTLLSLAAILAWAGCGKPKSQAPVVQGITIDVPKLRAALGTSTPEVQTALEEVATGVRYRDFSQALGGLDKIARTPGLTEAQKKAVAEVTEQVKQVAGQKTAVRAP
jgi:cell pole-organizing protein PopZ